MATDADTAEDLLAGAALGARLTVRKMFGEYCVYLDGKPVALLCDNTLFLKVTEPGQALFPRAKLGPPYPGAKAHLIVPRKTWTDADRMKAVFEATFQALPPVKPKKNKKNKN
jgi:TfoX/Sxy family transcriptional regulator of competence genes